MSRFKFGGGMGYNINNLSKNPPSRANSKRGTRDYLKRADSANRLMNDNKSKTIKSRGGASLARTTGKKQGRIIINEKTESKPSVIKNTVPNYPSNSLPIGDYKMEYKGSSITKPVITTYSKLKIKIEVNFIEIK